MLTACSSFPYRVKVTNVHTPHPCPISVHPTKEDKVYLKSLDKTAPQSFKNLMKNYGTENNLIDKTCNEPKYGK